MSRFFIASTWLSLGAGAFAQDPDPYFYFYLGEPIPLGATPDAVAVFDRANGSSDPLQTLLEDASVPQPQVERHPIGGGWYTVRFDAASTEAPSGIPSMITTLIERDASGRFFFSPVFIGPSGGPVIVPPDILILFEEGVGTADVERLLKTGGVHGGTRLAIAPSLGNAFKVSTNERSGIDVLAISNQLSALEEVVFAEPNLIITGRSGGDASAGDEVFPDDPEFPDSWGLDNTGQFPGAVPGFDVNATKAWGLTFGDPEVITVVIDVGVDQGHPDIRQGAGRDFTGEGGDGGPVNECDNHGTAVAGVISGKAFNNIGTVGVAPQTLIVSARTFISNVELCDGTWNAEFQWTVDALQWAIDIGARITNNSNRYDTPSSVITLMYNQTSNELLHFASAGNQEVATEITYPANLGSVLAVTGMDWDGSLYFTSSWGPEAAFTAPGRTILTTDRTGPSGFSSLDTVFATGTSFATAMAAGIAALMLSRDSNLLPAEVLDILNLSTTDLGTPGPDVFFGKGLPNSAEAVKLAGAHMIFANGFESGDTSQWACTEP